MGAHDIRIQVSYDILTQTEDYLSLVVSGTESWTSAYSELRYYTLDMHTGKWIALEDVLERIMQRWQLSRGADGGGTCGRDGSCL